MSTIGFDSKVLDAIIKALGAQPPTIRIGILGQKNTIHKNKDGDDSHPALNAEIGAAHEFGTTKMPRRSFLRMPLSLKLQEYMEQSGAFKAKAMWEIVKARNLKPWFSKVGVLSERIVQDAFNSGGFGKWAKWKTKGYENNTGMILVDTQQLRNSISHELKEGSK